MGTRLLLILVAVSGVGCGRSDWLVAELSPPDEAPFLERVELDGSASGGGVSKSEDNALCSRVEVDSQGRVVVAWMDSSTGVEEIYLRRWQDDAWHSLGGSAEPGGISQGTGVVASGGYKTCMGGIAFDTADAPHVAWMSYQGGATLPVYLRWWSGSAWQPLGNSDTGGGIADGMAAWWPDLVMTSNGPASAWERGSDIYLRQWNGADWVGVADSDQTPLSEATRGRSVKLERGPNDELYVGFVGVDPNIAVLTVYDGTWHGLGGSAAPPGLAVSADSVSSVLLAVDASGRPVFGWNQTADSITSTHLVWWNDSAWVGYGSEANLTTAGLHFGALKNPSLAMMSDDPILVWEEDDDLGRNIYGAYWHGDQWQPLGSDATGGISATAERSEWPTVNTRGDSVLVKWNQVVGTNRAEVYLVELQ